MAKIEFPSEYQFGCILGEGKAEMRTAKLPEPGDNDILVKMNVCNICTNDYQQFNGLRKKAVPMAAGHECSGIVIWKGKNVGPAIEVGMQVANNAPGCGVCYHCRTGRTDLCTGKINGGMEQGPFEDGCYGRPPGQRGFGSYMVMPAVRLIEIANDIDPACAAFLEPFSAVVHALRWSNVQACDNVAVVGAGTMGMVSAQVAHALGARVIMTEMDDGKIARARAMGFADVIDIKTCDPVEAVRELTKGEGADVVIPTFAGTKAYEQGYKMMRDIAGKFVLYGAGYPAPSLPAEMTDPNKIHYSKMQIIGTFGANSQDCAIAAKLISDRKVHPEQILQQKERIPLRDIQKAYELASTPGTYRVSVDLQGV